MQSKSLIQILNIATMIGAVIVAVGLYILLFTDVTTNYGFTALRDDVELIVLGMVLMIPARMLVTFKLMKVSPGESDETDESSSDNR